MRPNFEFQILVLRVLAFMLRQIVWSEQRSELESAITDGINNINGERRRYESKDL
jgi:hypothetical protein